jgi:uncharacterized integral membrane protein
MRSFKTVVFVIVVLFLAIVVAQNWEFLEETKPVEVNLGIWDYKTQEIPLGLYFLAFFLVGLLISYFYGLSERFKAKKSIQNHTETIRKLEREVEALKRLSAQEERDSSEQSNSA